MRGQYREIAIIGAGPAGIATAIQLRRYGHRPLVFEAGPIGGLLCNANLIENMAGFPEGISGKELVAILERQFFEYDPELRRERVLLANFHDDAFEIQTETGTTTAGTLVVASGTAGKLPENIAIPEEASATVFTEVAPIVEIEGKTIAIVGAGDSALDYALNLAKKNRAMVLNRGGAFKALQILLDRAKSLPNIDIRLNTAISTIQLGEDEKLSIVCEKEGVELELEVDYLIFAIGRRPRLDFLSRGLAAQSAGLTAAGRLYFAGDVARDRFRQTAIAFGDGVAVAMRIAHRLLEVK